MRFSFTAREIVLFSKTSRCNKSVAYPSSASMDNRSSCTRDKRPANTADHSPLSSADINSKWISNSTPSCARHAVHTDNSSSD